MQPLIAPKSFAEYGPDEYHAYISGFYALPEAKRGSRPKSPVSGLTVGRTKAGKLTVRRNAKQRAFPYATMAEIRALAEHAKASQADVWNLLKQKEFILGQNRMECEKIWAEVNEIPWGGAT